MAVDAGWRRRIGTVVVLVAAALVASVVVGIPVFPGVPRTLAAGAAGSVGRMCAGAQVSGPFSHPANSAEFNLFVPAGATATFVGSADVLGRDGLGFRQTGTVLTMDGVVVTRDYLGTSSGNGPFDDRRFGGSWLNNGLSRDVRVTFLQDDNNSRVDWRLTSNLSSGLGSGVCTPMGAGESLGDNCAEKRAARAQAFGTGPVNTATGNFHPSFTDFAIPGHGPGLAPEHSYNSLRADVDGPVGFGWTHAYATMVAVDASTGVATLSQEGGAQVSFYPDGAGGFAAPPRAVATLVKNPDGSFTVLRCDSTTLQFSSTGQLTSVTDRNGYTTTLGYTAGRLTGVTDASGRSLTYGWTGARITSISDGSAPPRSVTFAYNGAGDLTDYIDAAGNRWRFTYDAAHHLTNVRRPSEVSTSTPPVTRYDPAHRVVSQTDELNRTTTFDYTSIPGSTKVTDPKGDVSVIAYKNLLPTSLTRGWGTPAAATWTFETDITGGVSKVTDPNNHVARNAYDGHGNILSSTDGANRVTRATYNSFDEPLTVTDATGVTATYAYDGNGNLKTVSTPLVGSAAIRQVSYGYDPARPGDVVSVTDPKGKVWSRGYDGFGDLISETDPLGGASLYGYDTATGWLTSAVSARGAAAGVRPGCVPPALGCATFAHDAAGRVTIATDAKNHHSTRHYNTDGSLDYQIDAVGNRTDIGYDTANQPVTVRRADGTQLSTTYWPNGSVKDTIDGAGRATAHRYDTLGRLVTSTDPDGRTTTYGYDLAGNPTSKSDLGGSCPGATCTTMAYDAADQLTSVSYGDGTTPNVTNITYDGVGRRTAMTDGSGTSTWLWDSLGRLTSTKDGAGRIVAYGYGNLRDPATTITYPGNKTVTHGFDDAGRMTTIRDWLSNTTTYTPDADSNITAVALPAGTGAVDTTVFDDADRLVSITDKTGTATTASFTYGRDDNGQVTSTSTTGLADTHSYTYTSLNQLKTADGATLGHDSAGNLTGLASGAALAYDPANQLTSLSDAAGVTAVAFDTRGNRTTLTPPAATGLAASSYKFDQANRMVEASTPTAAGDIPVPGDYDGNGTTDVAVYRPSNGLWYVQSPFSVVAWGQAGDIPVPGDYDGNGTTEPAVYRPSTGTWYLRSTTPTSTPWGATTSNQTSTYTYDGSGLRTSKTVAGTTTPFSWEGSSGLPLLIDDGTNNYIYGPDGLPLEHIDRTNTVTWYHHDQLGSTRTLTNNNGAVIATTTYDPYGHPTATTGNPSPLGYAGQYTDRETGLIYLRTRYHDPTTGQFTTRDPIEGQTHDPYGYAAGNPLNATDPTGLCPLCIAFIAGALIGGAIDIGTQLIGQAIRGCGINLANINWTSVATSAAIGGLLALTGVLATEAAAAEASTGEASVLENVGAACHSFAPATLVILADGTRKAISEVAVGDQVRTTDPGTGGSVVRAVTALHRNHDTDLANVVVRDGGGHESTIHTTQLHRFWDDTRGGWVHAGELGDGDRLHSDDGDAVTVASVHSFAGLQWMYDLTVDDVHTFYVLAGTEAVLVHNCGRLAPDLDAVGPHTTFSHDPVTGEITHYATWEPNPYPNYPSDWIRSSHYDGVGRAHFSKVTGEYIPTPHVQGPAIPGGVRLAEPWEIPRWGAQSP